MSEAAALRSGPSSSFQPAAIASYQGNAYGLGVLTVTPTGITAITVFAGGPAMAARFGLTPPHERA